MFSGVAAGVVQADRGARDKFFGELDLLMLEGVGVLGAREGRHAQGGAAGLEGKGEHVGGRVGSRRVLGQAPQADGVQFVVRGVLRRGVIGAVSYPAEGGVGAEVLWFLPAQDGFEDVHDDGLGEFGDHEFRQFAGRMPDVQGSSDTAARPAEQSETLPCHIAVGDVEAGLTNSDRPAFLVLKPEVGARPDAFMMGGQESGAPVPHVDHGGAGAGHALDDFLDTCDRPVSLLQHLALRQNVLQEPSGDLLERDSELLLDRGVDPAHLGVRVVDHELDGRFPVESVKHGPAEGLPVCQLGIHCHQQPPGRAHPEGERGERQGHGHRAAVTAADRPGAERPCRTTVTSG